MHFLHFLCVWRLQLCDSFRRVYYILFMLILYLHNYINLIRKGYNDFLGKLKCAAKIIWKECFYISLNENSLA